MQGKDSISFGSIRESSVWHNQDPPMVGDNLSVTFQQMPATSRSYLEGYIVRKIPAEKTSTQMNKFMQKNLDVVCLLQAAEIRRLINNLEEHQIKFKQLQLQPLDRQSYEIQIRELAETSHSLEVSNEQTRQKSQKLRQFIMKQNVEIEKLTEELRRKEKVAGEVISYQQELQDMARKYEKAIQSLNKVFDDNEHLTALSTQLSEENNQLKQQLELLKQHVLQLAQRKQAFEQQRIREVQRMRDTYEAQLFQTCTQLTQQVQSNFVLQKHSLLQQISKLKQQANDSERKIDLMQQRLTVLSEENTKLVEQVKEGYNELQDERNRANHERSDFDQKFKLFGDEIERLNLILGQKQTRIKAVVGQVQKSRDCLLQLSNQKQQLQSAINKLNQQKSDLNSKLTKTKQQLNHITKQKHQEESSLQQTRKHLQHYLQKENHYQITINEHLQYIQQLKHQNKANIEQTKQLKLNIQNLQSKLSQILQNNSEASFSKEMVIRNYQQKIKDYFEQNLSLKQQHHQLKHEHQTIAQQNINIKHQLTLLTSQITQQNTKELQELRNKCKQLHNINTLVEAKLKSLERQKQSIQKQLEKQVLCFMENNHKTQTMLHQHNHSIEMINYQQQYTQNHSLLLKQIQRMSREFLLKQDELMHKQSAIERLEKQVKRLVTVIESLQNQVITYKETVINDINHQNHELKHITQNVQKLSLQKQLSLQNSQLYKQVQHLQQNLHSAQQNLSQSQEITHKSIELTTENVRLKHELDKMNSELIIYKNHTQNLEQSLNLIKAQYTHLIEEKQHLIKSLTQRASLIQREKINEGGKIDQLHKDQRVKEQSVVNRNIEHLLQQFRQLNQSLMNKLSLIQQKQHHALQQIVQSSKVSSIIRGNHMSQFPSSNRLPQNQSNIFHQNQSGAYNRSMLFPQNLSNVYQNGQSHLFGQNQSNVLGNPIESQTQMSFNPSKFLQTTKIPEDSNESVRQFIHQLKQELQSLEKRAIESQEQLAIYKEKHIGLQMQAQHYEQKIRKYEIAQSNSELKLQEIHHLNQVNNKFMQQNKRMIEENETLLQKLHQKQLLLNQKEQRIQDYNQKFISLSTHTDQFSTQLQALEQQNHQITLKSAHFQKQSQELSLALELSQKQNLNLTQQLNHHKQQQLLLQSKTSTLEQSNYNYALQLKKQKITHNKVQILNQQLERLQKENLDLIEQLDLCKFEICSDVSLQRKNQELLTVLVMTFVEVQSLRSRVKEKDAELTTIRKSNLNVHKHP